MELASQRWRRHVPNVATALTLLLGLGAIEAARFGDVDLGLRFIMLAILADGLDGALARRWGTASGFGGHLDALADIVAFAVAPAVLFAAVHPDAPGPVRFAIMGALVLAGSYRLARFQAEPGHSSFAGLPITIAGPLFALAVAGVQRASLMDAAAWGLALSALMVSRVPYFRSNSGPMRRLAPFLAATFVIVLAIDGQAAFLAAQLSLILYVAIGLGRGVRTVALRDRPVLGGRGRGE